MANGIYAIGTKLAFNYIGTDGTVKPRIGTVMPPVKTQLHCNVVWLETLEGTRSFRFDRIENGKIEVLA